MRFPRPVVRFLLLQACLHALGESPAFAQVRPVSAISAARPEGVRAMVAVDHLVLRGASFRHALDALGTAAPVDEDGDLANAITHFDLLPHLRPVRERGGCRPQGVSIDVTVRTLLPEWADRDGAPAGDRRRWRDFITTLASHEDAHRDITLRHAEKLLESLRELSASSCPRLVRRVHGAVERSWSELREAHAALDAADRWAGHR